MHRRYMLPADCADCTWVHFRQIEEKRKKLLETAEKYGLQSTETLACSQELDQLIVEAEVRSLFV
ncbi:MAG: aspartyl-phosphate phosphatase Spo0E family protein [Sporolactobacillus sp.]